MITNPCGVAHFQNRPCRECERLRKIKSSPDILDPGEVIGPEVRGQGSVPARDTVVSSDARRDSLGASLGLITDEAPLTNAERHQRYREKHGDSYRKRNAERMREARKK